MKVLAKKIQQIYMNLSVPVKASIWFTICNILQKGISLLTTPIFTRILTTEQYGTFSVYQSWYAIISILGTLNLYSSVFNNGMVKYPEDRKTFSSSMLGLSTLCCTILFAIYLVNVDFWNSLLGLSTVFIVAMFAEMVFTPAFSFWSAEERFEFRYRKLVVYTLLLALLCPIISIICVIGTEYKAEARVVGMVLVQVVFSSFFYVYIIAKGRKVYVKEYWKYALKFNIPLIPHYLSMVVLQQADRIMIGQMAGNNKAAIYSIAYNISMLMTLITSGINSSYTPYAYQSIQQQQYKKLGKVGTGLLMFVGVSIFGVMALAPELIRVFATSEYYEAVWIVPPVAASVFFMFFYNVFTTFEFYYEKTVFVMIASVLGAVLNIILNYYGIKKFGYLAAGYTTLICYILFGVAHYIFSMHVLKVKIGNNQVFSTFWLVVLSAVVLLGMFCMTLTYQFTWLRYSILALMIVVFVACREKIIDLIKIMKEK